MLISSLQEEVDQLNRRLFVLERQNLDKDTNLADQLEAHPVLCLWLHPAGLDELVEKHKLSVERSNVQRYVTDFRNEQGFPVEVERISVTLEAVGRRDDVIEYRELEQDVLKRVQIRGDRLAIKEKISANCNLPSIYFSEICRFTDWKKSLCETPVPTGAVSGQHIRVQVEAYVLLLRKYVDDE